MSLADLENDIDKHIEKSGPNHPILNAHINGNNLRVIKYMPGSRLQDALKLKSLYASERVGFTWGDAIYVASIKNPRTTMMYGDVGVVGTFQVTGARFFNACDSTCIDLYQQWIVHQNKDYRDLTTTVHASAANRELRNNFRCRFQIDCVYFRPDELCPDYVDPTDLWFAITHWDATRVVGHGFSQAVVDLKWCVVGPDSFQPDGRGYRASLHKHVSAGYTYVPGHYSSLDADIINAYAAPTSQVVVCDFS